MVEALTCFHLVAPRCWYVGVGLPPAPSAAPLSNMLTSAAEAEEVAASRMCISSRDSAAGTKMDPLSSRIVRYLAESSLGLS